MTIDADEIAQAAASQVNSLFEQRRADGGYVYSTEELEHFLPAVALLLLRPGDELSPELALSVAKGVLAAGCDEALPPDQIFAKLIEHYRQHPPHRSLVTAVNRILRETLGAASSPQVARAAARALLGTVEKRLAPAGERPAGTIPAGPMARFQTLAPASKKKDED